MSQLYRSCGARSVYCCAKLRLGTHHVFAAAARPGGLAAGCAVFSALAARGGARDGVAGRPVHDFWRYCHHIMRADNSARRAVAQDFGFAFTLPDAGYDFAERVQGGAQCGHCGDLLRQP